MSLYFRDRRQFVLMDKKKEGEGGGNNPPPADDKKKTPGEEGDDDKGDEDGEEDDQDPDDKELGFSEKQQAYIKKLRAENAKHRTESKELKTKLSGVEDRFSKIEKGLKGIFGDDDQELTPEEKLSKITQEKEEIEFNNLLAESAIEHGVSKENLKYFKFLVAEKASELKDGEELTDDVMKALAKEASKRSAGKSTSVNGKDGGTPPPDEEDGEVSFDEFKTMGISARSALYQKNQALYTKLAQKERASK